ncbi:Crp/Fnr family transcriptional regulator [Desulfosporosinus sp. OT]|uniref:Crp/Fnr family transcriptional regulator n=1 Tax=Desulfosporosinus sp. OT TaxID=913865 RepID=UPI000223A75E|nr:Crp/Fnr family transcriptional regulator [Desulfosporosinus sp. OT]EGW39110.1 cyclic nucleotide-binding domain protein [Desulfosporosinus sp. OT]
MELFKMNGVEQCEFKKGSYIIRQGENVDYLYYLTSGTCYRTLITEKGDEIIYGIKESNNSIRSIMGVLSLFSNGISAYHFIAKSKCCCLKIPKDTFLKYVQDDANILRQLLQMATGNIRELVDSLQARNEGKVGNRLCKFLLNKSQDDHGVLLVNKYYSNATISRFLGIHKVTVAKILRALKNEGILKKEKDGIIILNENKLTSYANDEKIIDYF